MSNPENPFADFETDFKSADKADPAATPGRVPPETYKFVLTAADVKGDGVLADHEVFVANSGSKGFKLFCEILEPESVPNPKTSEPHITKGVVLEHVFWVTQKNLPYIKRDISTILERDLGSLTELTTITWAGRTFEGVVKDETRDGYTRSKIAFINAWVPPAEDKKEDSKKTDANKTKPTQPAKGAAGPAKGAAATKTQPASKSDF